MNAPAHIRGDMHNAPLASRAERYRWTMQQRRLGRSWAYIGKQLGISKMTAYSIELRGDPASNSRPTRYEVSFRKADGSPGKHVVAAPTQEVAETRALRPYPGAVVVGVKRYRTPHVTEHAMQACRKARAQE